MSAEILSKYQAGFSQCATEITNYLNNLSDLDKSVKDSIMTHVTESVERLRSFVTSQEEEKMDDSCSTRSDTENESPDDTVSPVSERRQKLGQEESSSDGEHSSCRSLQSPCSDEENDPRLALKMAAKMAAIPSGRRIVFGDFQLVIQKTSEGHCFRFPENTKLAKRGHRVQATTVSVPGPFQEQPTSTEQPAEVPDMNNNSTAINYNTNHIPLPVNPWRPW